VCSCTSSQTSGRPPCEESGRAALWRRLDALCRGRAIDRDRLRGRLFVAANARVKLDDSGWQAELVETGQRIEPRLIALDPLARMKAAGREENSQTDMAALVEYLRLLRDETTSAVGFVHHTGHAGDTMRGSSDLESIWESRLAWKRDGQSSLVEITANTAKPKPANPSTTASAGTATPARCGPARHRRRRPTPRAADRRVAY
jgi:hypothetical protein